MNALTGDMARSNKEEFASRLLRWRTQRGWSREESAAKLCVSHRTLQEWEQGRRVPSEMAQRGVFARMQEIERATDR
jgi:transcriptional regulator with XRE-family HTH domain